MHRSVIICAVGASLVLQGCSSRPREFTPTISALSTDQQAFDANYAACQQLFVAGKLDQNGRMASAGVGAATAGTVAVLGGAAAGSAGLAGGMAIASATVVLLPFALIGGAFGMAKIKRGNKEKAIKSAMTGCLKERGYDVTGWEKAKKKPRVARVS